MRRRKLNFPVLVLCILRKGLKSMQLMLNELSLRREDVVPMTKSAYSQARHKLRHTAFIELNDIVVGSYYRESFQQWRGYRLLAVDGSVLTLPESAELVQYYGGQRIPETHAHAQALLPCAKLSVCYDVLNEVGLNATLAPYRRYEVELVKTHAKVIKSGDVVILDRHYASYACIAWLSQQGYDFVIRCPKSTFREANPLFAGTVITDYEAVLTAPGGKIKRLKRQGLPRKVNVRFIRLKLPTGEVEVLATSLLDKQLLPADFLQVYGLRWKLETYYHRLKERLALENFTVKHQEGVLQDLYATLFISNLETVLTEDINQGYKRAGYPRKVNKAVSFHLIKHQAFELLYDKNIDIDKLLKQMLCLFKQSPVTVKEGRKEPRDRSGPYRRLRFLKTLKKICF